MLERISDDIRGPTRDPGNRGRRSDNPKVMGSNPTPPLFPKARNQYGFRAFCVLRGRQLAGLASMTRKGGRGSNPSRPTSEINALLRARYVTMDAGIGGDPEGVVSVEGEGSDCGGGEISVEGEAGGFESAPFDSLEASEAG
jgi:hypothetical protein